MEDRRTPHNLALLFAERARFVLAAVSVPRGVPPEYREVCRVLQRMRVWRVPSSAWRMASLGRTTAALRKGRGEESLRRCRRCGTRHARHGTMHHSSRCRYLCIQWGTERSAYLSFEPRDQGGSAFSAASDAIATRVYSSDSYRPIMT